MENNLTVFKEQEILGKHFRVFGTPEEPLFLAKDVAEWIEHKDVSTMVRTVDDSEKLTQTMFVSGQNRDVLMLTEDGLYEILMQSRKPIAKEFKKQVKEILRSVRKHGAYITTETMEKVMADPDFIIGLVTSLKEEQFKRKEAELLIEEQKPKVELYDELIDSNGLLNFKEVADSFGLCGRNTLMATLRKENILSDNPSNKNLPYSRYSKAGLFKVKITPRRTKNGVEDICTTLCTTKAIPFIKKILDKKKDLLQPT